MDRHFYVLVYQKSEGNCFSINKLPEEMDNDYCLNLMDGISVEEHFPNNARYVLSDIPEGRDQMEDIIPSGDYLIGSSAFKDIISEICSDIEIEFLPFTIFSEDNLELSNDYFFINPIGVFDCLNEELSAKGRDLILDKQKVHSAPHFFRVKGYSQTYIVSSLLVGAFMERKLKNIFLHELEIK